MVGELASALFIPCPGHGEGRDGREAHIISETIFYGLTKVEGCEPIFPCHPVPLRAISRHFRHAAIRVSAGLTEPERLLLGKYVENVLLGRSVQIYFCENRFSAMATFEAAFIDSTTPVL